MVHGSYIITDTGVLTDDQAEIFQSQISDNKYANVYIRRASTDLQITRSFDRIDKLLSYIRGLFITIIGFGEIFLYWYNEI